MTESARDRPWMAAEEPLSASSAGNGLEPILDDLRAVADRAQHLPANEIIDLLREDQRERWGRGNAVPAELYLQATPILIDNEHFFDLVYSEYLIREELGEAPTFEEYQLRFPFLARQLQRQLELHAAVGQEEASGPSHTATYDQNTPVRGSVNNWPELAGYEIVTELGHGGMGVVYQAWQPALRRYVAIKMLRAGETPSPDAMKRLQTEAAAVASLQHPNIVRIFEVGQHEGFPYLVLEYVTGGSLARLLQSGPQPAIPSARFVAVLARAVHHAHTQRLIHRDLKPANILLQPVDDRQEITSLEQVIPRISDFGLAKQLDLWNESGNVHTQTGQILGTPAYMAPEQAWGQREEIGPTTDVYALGSILYESLTGRPPFQTASPLMTVVLVRSSDPVPPSRLQPGLPRDLETICLRCLEKEPRQRYASAADLADDLERFARQEPIRARPLGPFGRGWRWCRRRPAVAGLLAGLFLTVFIGLILTGQQWRRAEHNLAEMTVQWSRAEELQRVAEERAAQLEAERQRTVGLQKEAERQKDLAVKSLARAREAIDRFYLEITRDEQMRQPGLQELRRRLLTNARDYYREFIEEAGDDAFTRNQLGRAAGWLARISGEIGSKQEAIQYYLVARTTFERLLQEVPAGDANRSRYRNNVAITNDALGILHAETGRSREALDFFREAIRGREALLQEELEKTARIRYEMALAGTWTNIGNVDRGLGRYPEAQKALTHARDLQVRLSKNMPDDIASLGGLVSTSVNLALLERDMGQMSLAEENLQRARVCGERLLEKTPSEALAHRNLGEVYLELGVLQIRRLQIPGWAGLGTRLAHYLGGPLPLAFGPTPMQCYERAAACYSQAAALQPATHQFKHNKAATLNSLAVEYLKSGRPGEARTHLERARAIEEELVRAYDDVAEYHRDLGKIFSNLGVVELQCNNVSGAVEALRLARNQFEIILKRTPGIPDSLGNLGETLLHSVKAYTRLGEEEQAEAALLEAVEIFRGIMHRARNVQRHRVDYGMALATATAWYMERRRHHRALPLLAERERIWSVNQLELLAISADYALGASQLAQVGNAAEARPWSEKARATLLSAFLAQLRPRKLPPPPPPRLPRGP